MNTDNLLILIFTDLDGSLLDHYSYSFEPATTLLQQLHKRSFPIIFNTSKTRAELIELRRNLANSDPFIVENGAAVYIPADTELTGITDLSFSEDYFCKPFSLSRRHWLDQIKQLPSDLQSKFHGFSDFSVEELASATGLSEQNAERALAREYNEPGTWAGTQTEKNLFIKKLNTAGAVILAGGRFLHIGGKTDKGAAMNWLVELYRKQFPEKQIISLALGDSNNDLDMLEQAERSVVIKSPVHPYPKLKKTQQVYYTVNQGPDGWVEGLNHHLQQLKLF